MSCDEGRPRHDLRGFDSFQIGDELRAIAAVGTVRLVCCYTTDEPDRDSPRPMSSPGTTWPINRSTSLKRRNLTSAPTTNWFCSPF